jgi:hypothetical protein
MALNFDTGPNGIFYVSTHRPGEGMMLTSIASDGRLRWRARLGENLFNVQLRIGPDRRLYQVTPDSWIPVADASGYPLSVADQQRLTLRYQPLPGGRRLVTTYVSPREVRADVRDTANQPVRTWQLISATDLGHPGTGLPADAGADVVLPLAVYTQPPASRSERLVLRQTATGAPVRLHLQHTIWGDQPVTELRTGPNGAFYQLQTSRTTGVTINRYDLHPPAPTPSPTGAAVVPAPTASTAPATPTGPVATATVLDGARDEDVDALFRR